MEKDEECEPKKNPRLDCCWMSNLFFLYMLPVFYTSFNHNLKQDELFVPLDEHKSSYLGDELEKYWNQYQHKYRKYALHLAVFRVFGCDFLLMGVILLIKELISVIFVPILICRLVSYFSQNDDTPSITSEEAYYYALALTITMIAERVLSHPPLFGMLHLGMKLRLACNALIYRKILRLSQNALARTTVGHIVNLITNDVRKFDQVIALVHYALIAPLQTAVGVYMLHKHIGNATFCGIAFLLLLLPLQTCIAKRSSFLRRKTAKSTDERIRLTNEMITGMQVIKMFVWEDLFATCIDNVRRKELKTVRSSKTLRAFTYAVESAASRIAIFISLVAFALLGNRLTAETAFGVTSVYNVIKTGITYMMTMGMNGIAEISVSLTRIATFLTYEEVRNEGNSSRQEQAMIELQNVSAKWNPNEETATLSNISFCIRCPTLFAIIGPVGSGKSNLFNVILSELQFEGDLRLDGRISYCSQVPWLFSASVRDNILFGNVYDEERYRNVCQACQLDADFHRWAYRDRTLVGERGQALSGGQKARINLARCIYKDADIYLLDDPLSAVDPQVGGKLFEMCIKTRLKEKICLLITHQLQYLQHTDEILILDGGRMSAIGSFQQLRQSQVNFASFLHDSKDSNKKIEKEVTSEKNEKMSNEDFCNMKSPLMEKEKVVSGKVTLETYKKYIRSGGSYFLAGIALSLFVIFESVSRLSDYFVAYWVKEEDSQQVESKHFEIISKFSTIIVFVALFAIVSNIYILYFLNRASGHLHNAMLKTLLKAKMFFFVGNPVGRILNKFSMDMGTLDEFLPNIVTDVLRMGCLLFGTLILTSIVNPMLLPPAILLLCVFYLMRLGYVGASRSLKRIEAVAKSPIYSQMTNTISGLSTIRAFSAQTFAVQQFDAYQDAHTSAWYLFLSATRAFGYWLDLICVFFLAIMIFALLSLSPYMFGATLGLIITQYMGLMGGLQWGMRQWTELENQMISVERVLEYIELDREPERPPKTNLPIDWPSKGRIAFRNVSMSYGHDRPVLENVAFVIAAGEKIGIVGRTGAGKTSLINAIFQLYEVKGSILIDNEDTACIPLAQIRSKISIIPQEPILFSGTMRTNLDPFNECSDDIIWSALEQVEMKSVIAAIPQSLSTVVCEGGSNYSVGQRQLICLARALIRRNRILVLDEATANIDHYTDTLIQKTIRDQFADCTVITIAHRLRSVMDSNKILVMDAGLVVDFDTPTELFTKQGSIFRRLCDESGISV